MGDTENMQPFKLDSSAAQDLRVLDEDRATLVARVRVPYWYCVSLAGSTLYLELVGWAEVHSPASVFGGSLVAWAVTFGVLLALGMVWVFASAWLVSRECGRIVKNRQWWRRMSSRGWLYGAIGMTLCWGGVLLMMVAGYHGVPLIWLLLIPVISAVGFAMMVRCMENELLRLVAERNLL